MAQPQATIVMPTTAQYGPTSQATVCPYCHSQVATSVQSEATTKTHMAACCLCLFICWPCVCLPYFMDSCQNTNHYCPNCRAFLGTYQS